MSFVAKVSLNRYNVGENKLGQGSFGKVLHYKIQNTSEDVAVKFIKRKEGLKELKMLKKINAFDPDKNCFLKMLDHFEYKSLICVVFEKLDQTLSDIFLKRNQRPFDVCELRPVAQQLLVALRALKTIGLVHCDIKLNNVMFVNHQSYPYKVKLIDFGLAREKTSLRRLSNIQIVGYKAPEVVFDCPLDEAVDMWSVGCVLAGMYKAKHFYPRTCLYDYIASIIHMQGQPPDNVLLKGSVYSFRKPSEYMGSPINTFRNVEEFKSLIKQMLCVDQKTRITPEEALNHNFFTMKHLSEGTKDPYVTSAREIMSVCEPVTTMQPDAPKRHPEHRDVPSVPYPPILTAPPLAHTPLPPQYIHSNINTHTCTHTPFQTHILQGRWDLGPSVPCLFPCGGYGPLCNGGRVPGVPASWARRCSLRAAGGFTLHLSRECSCPWGVGSGPCSWALGPAIFPTVAEPGRALFTTPLVGPLFSPGFPPSWAGAAGPCLAPPWTSRGPGGWLPGVRSGSPLGGPGSYLGLGRGDARNSWVVVGCSSGAVGVRLRWGPALGSPGAAGGLLSWLGWGGALSPSVLPCSLALGALRRSCWPWPGWRAWSPGRRLFPAGSRVALGGFRLPLLLRWGSWGGDGWALSLLLSTFHHPF
uniref:Protein kinase domain-containing protein n=1 Tax=Oryzias latipes TaxID=8090 RepID=A0A3P9JBG3_ORYLA